MITFKYKKTGSAIFISHIDTLRGMARTFRRTGADVEFSKGYNPHMLLFFSPPLALGVSSEAEYVTAAIKDMKAEKALEAYNKSCPNGFEATAAFDVTDNPNLAAKIAYAEYFIPVEDKKAAFLAVQSVGNASEYFITSQNKDGESQKEIRSKIKSLELVKGGMRAVLATGNDNLRADRLATAFNSDFNTDIFITEIIKTRQFVINNGQLMDADDYIRSL